MNLALIYGFAALTEIAGCFAFWLWLREGRSLFWTVPGSLLLILFAWALTRVPTEAAGRAFAAYGGVYIAASLIWLWLVEGVKPGRYDMIGALLSLAGAVVILAGAKAHLAP